MMKSSTKLAIHSIEDALCAEGFVRLKRGFMLWKKDGPVSLCMSIGYREWADGVCTLNPVLQSYWEEVERAHADVIGRSYKKFDQPTRVKLIALVPPLNYFSGQSDADVSRRLVDWVNQYGVELVEDFCDEAKLLIASIAALRDSSFMTQASKVYVMDRLLNPRRSKTEAYDLILGQLSRDWDREQFKQFYLLSASHSSI